MSVEVIHDHVQAQLAGIACSQAPKGRQDVPSRFPASARAHEAVVVNIIEPQELFGPLGAVVGGPLAPGMRKSRLCAQISTPRK